MDGTLLNDNHEVSNRFFDQFKILSQRGIEFAAASGRQYSSIRHSLKHIKNDINIIAENGGILQYQNEVFTLQKLKYAQVQNCIDVLRTIKNSYIVLCGRKAAYIEQHQPTFLKVFKNYYHKIQKVKDLKKIFDDDFLKIAVFHFESSENHLLPYAESLREDLKVIVSAKNWLDISPLHSNKGYALDILQNKLGITRDETMVFGDYNNDLEMLKLGEYSFAMENAHYDVKAIANYKTKSNNDHGVEHILDILIKS